MIKALELKVIDISNLGMVIRNKIYQLFQILSDLVVSASIQGHKIVLLVYKKNNIIMQYDNYHMFKCYVEMVGTTGR